MSDPRIGSSTLGFNPLGGDVGRSWQPDLSVPTVSTSGATGTGGVSMPTLDLFNPRSATRAAATTGTTPSTPKTPLDTAKQALQDAYTKGQRDGWPMSDQLAYFTATRQAANAYRQHAE